MIPPFLKGVLLVVPPDDLLSKWGVLQMPATNLSPYSRRGKVFYCAIAKISSI
jgi:hypothetical protein